jgi:hypothetical protein
MKTPSLNPSKIIKFKTLSIIENGIIVNDKKNTEKPISFSDVESVYIKK